MAELKVLRGEFPCLRRALDLGDFHPDLAGNVVEVWLNPSRDWMGRFVAHNARIIPPSATQMRGEAKLEELSEETREQYFALITEALEAYPLEERNAEDAALYSELWDCTAEDAGALLSIEAPLTNWLVGRTWDLIGEYRAGRLAKNPMSG